MDANAWVKEFPGAVTVCDAAGRILAMNDKAAEVFAADGGAALIGTNVLDCHPEPSRTMLKGMLESGRANVYTIRKNGKKKLIYQAPWSENGRYAGFVELSLELPDVLPHFDRDVPPKE
jgi:transcriptional regulator with PAS, ATPase and Fis domain